MRRFVLAFLLLWAGAAVAAPLGSDFRNGTQGWSVIAGEMTAAADGARHWIEIQDRPSILATQLVAPVNLIGDLRPYYEGSFSFEAKEFVGDAAWSGDFGRVTITGNGRTISRDLWSGPLSGSWTRITGPLTPEFWGLPPVEFAAFLASVTSLRINIESSFNSTERVGVTNVFFTAPAVPVEIPAIPGPAAPLAVPVPAMAGGAALALLAALGLRRRATRSA